MGALTRNPIHRLKNKSPITNLNVRKMKIKLKIICAYRR